MNKALSAILKAAVATSLYIIGVELLGSWFFIAEAINFENYHQYYSLIQGALQLIAVLIFLFFIRNRTYRNLIKVTHYKWYLVGLVLGSFFVFLQTPLNSIYNLSFGTEYSITYRFDGMPLLKDINWLSTILLVPIGEEIFFREYIQNNLQKKTNTVVAILFASVLFASIHSPYMNLILELSKQDWHQFYMTFFGGLISGILYYKSKSIGPSIIFHISWNLFVTIV